MTALETNGGKIKICGYACFFDTTITHRGEALTFARDAFLPTLRYNASGVRALVDHKRASEWACTRDGSLRVWQDDTGLGFSAIIPNTIEGRGLARAVADGYIGASVHFRPFKTEETASGYIVQAATLTELSLTTRPAFPTAVWLAPIETMKYMTDYAQDLRRRWAFGSMKNRTKMAPAAILSHMKNRTARKLAARPRPASVPLAIEDIYPPGLGFSTAELEECAFQEEAGQRANKGLRACKQARQREQNRARRKARRVA